MDHIQGIEAGLASMTAHTDIARKIFLTYPTKAFLGAEEQQYQVVNAIAVHFDVPITSVQVAGSAKTGRSFHKKKDFVAGASDLDVAIIDARLFIKYAETVFKASKGFSDLSVFPVQQGGSSYADYMNYLGRGIFRPDLMTIGSERAAWNNFFGNLSALHTSLFRNITGCLYLSETFFASKQRSVIKGYLEDKGSI